MIVETYKTKIKSLDELMGLIGPRPRKRSVIMCHGTFDVVHPGHVRHLMYAKDKADSLEADLQPFVGGLVKRLSRHDTNPANNPQPPAEYRQ